MNERRIVRRALDEAATRIDRPENNLVKNPPWLIHSRSHSQFCPEISRGRNKATDCIHTVHTSCTFTHTPWPVQAAGSAMAALDMATHRIPRAAAYRPRRQKKKEKKVRHAQTADVRGRRRCCLYFRFSAFLSFFSFLRPASHRVGNGACTQHTALNGRRSKSTHTHRVRRPFYSSTLPLPSVRTSITHLPIHPPTCVCSGSATASRSTWRTPASPCPGSPRSWSWRPALSPGTGRASSAPAGKAAVSRPRPPGAGSRRRRCRRRRRRRHLSRRNLLPRGAACSRCSLNYHSLLTLAAALR